MDERHPGFTQKIGNYLWEELRYACPVTLKPLLTGLTSSFPFQDQMEKVKPRLTAAEVDEAANDADEWIEARRRKREEIEIDEAQRDDA